MITIDLRNASEHSFTDISSELARTYVFPNAEIRIDNPCWLSVSDSGGHRILDLFGVSHYVPSGWVHLYWKVADDQPHFVK